LKQIVASCPDNQRFRAKQRVGVVVRSAGVYNVQNFDGYLFGVDGIEYYVFPAKTQSPRNGEAAAVGQGKPHGPAVVNVGAKQHVQRLFLLPVQLLYPRFIANEACRIFMLSKIVVLKADSDLIFTA